MHTLTATVISTVISAVAGYLVHEVFELIKWGIKSRREKRQAELAALRHRVDEKLGTYKRHAEEKHDWAELAALIRGEDEEEQYQAELVAFRRTANFSNESACVVVSQKDSLRVVFASVTRISY
ncbi:unnamed protein product [Calypogeia fissa]